MSYDTHNTWLYRLEGRYIHLWQYIDGATTDTLGDYRIKLPNEYYGKQLIYPDEDITNGLRIEYTALIDTFVDEAWENLTASVSNSTINFQVADSNFITDDTNISFQGGEIDRIDGITDAQKYFYVGQIIEVTGTDSNDREFTITSVGSDYVEATGGINTEPAGNEVSIFNKGNALLGGIAGTDTFTDFESGDAIRVIGSASNDDDYVTTSKSTNGDALVLSSAPSAVEAYGESITVYQIPDEDASPSETSHLNLNRMLSLATVDFLKAQLADRKGDVQMKEYYMREFWKKVGDNNSNKRKISMSFPMSPYGVR